jgi:hypothetical protein
LKPDQLEVESQNQHLAQNPIPRVQAEVVELRVAVRRLVGAPNRFAIYFGVKGFELFSNTFRACPQCIKIGKHFCKCLEQADSSNRFTGRDPHFQFETGFQEIILKIEWKV